MPKLLQRMFVLMASIFLLAIPTIGQISNATVLGTVTDSQGARLPGVSIVLLEAETGISTTVKSDSQGLYSAPSLPIGTYTVQASMAGFKTSSAGPIELTVGKQQKIDFALEPGNRAENVTVTTEVPQVETSDTSIGFLVGSDQIQNLPLNGRNLAQLTLLTPGIQPVPQENTEGASTMVPFGFGSPQRFSVAGGRPQGQLLLLDGTDTAGVWGNGSGVNLAGTTLGVDAIQEFEAITNTYSSKYGGNGAVINSVIRSGTNQLHGSSYEFFRNNALDARNYFDPSTGTLPFNRNQFGGTIGGPIVKDRTFFFANYEGLRQSLTVPVYTAVPDANFRMGILPCDRTNLCPPGTAGSALINVGIAPGIAAYLNAFPVPNLPGSDGVAQNRSELSEPVSEDFGVAKVSHTLSASDAITASYLIDNGNITAHPTPTVVDADSERNQYLTLEERHIFSPTFLNVAHASVARSKIVVATVFNPVLQIVPQQPYNGTIVVNGLNTLGGADNAAETINRFTFRDQISLTKGRHSIEAGLEVVRHQIFADIPIINGGEVIYQQVFAPAFQEFLQNQPLAFAGVPADADNSRRDIRHTNLAPYFSDKFSVTPRLTLNLGLRYDFETNPIETNNLLYNLVNPLTDSGFTHVPHAFANNVTRYNYEPRVGFAWDVAGDHKLSIRGGFGIFDDLPLEMQVAIAYLFNPPVYNVETILFPTIPDPFGSGINATGLPGGAQLTSYNSKMNDYIMQYNLVAQRDLSNNTVLTLGYIGSRANHLYIGQETNACLPTSIAANGDYIRDVNPSTCAVPNPKVSSVVMRYPVGTSNYSSLQASLDKGFGRTVQFRSAYTFSKCLDYGSYYTGNDSIGPNGQTFGLQAGSIANVHNNDYGPCDFDLRNNWTNNVVYSLPFQGNRLKAGWQLTAIGSVHSGTPFSPYDAFDRANVGDSGAADNAERPDAVSAANTDPVGRRSTVNGVYYFNPSAFTLQPAGRFGNLGRNTLIAPGVRDLDLGVTKNTQIGEKMNLQLRAEAFNITNHTNFGFPNAALYEGVDGSGNAVVNPFAGQVTTTATTSRQIQFSGKFTF